MTDDALAKRLAQTLDQQAQQDNPSLDNMLEQVILQARVKPANTFFDIKHWSASAWVGMGSFAIAASLAMVMIVPSYFAQDDAALVVAAVNHPNVDPQFLEDFELVATLGDESSHAN
jgi:hypothetical protein